MKEYGGYLEFEHFDGNVYHSNCLALNSGRNCLRYVLRAKKINRIAIPYYICNAVIEACWKENVEVNFYSIDENFHPKDPLNVCETIYVVNYYGQLTNDYLTKLRDKCQNLIIDNSQAFFQFPIKGADTIYTCRKFFGVPDGAYLYTDVLLEDELLKQYSYSRLGFLAGRYEKTANEFYDDFQENEKFIEKQDIKGMSDIAANVLHAVDYKKVKLIREKNYQVLERNFYGLNEMQIQMGVGPYAYPLLIKNGKEMRRKLHKRKLYIPCLWPNVIGNKDYCRESYYAENILPLPCDQRYLEDDMLKIVDIVNRMLGEDV